MPAARPPSRGDAASARQILLTGLAGGAELPDLLTELAPLHPRHSTFPGEVFLRLAADALAWCDAIPDDPLPLEGDEGAVPARQAVPIRGTRQRGRA